MRLLALLLAFVASAAFGQYPSPARVVDEPGKLSASGKQAIAAMLQAEEKATGNQVVVVVVNSLQGKVLEDYSNGLMRAWGIGQRGKNNGALLLVAMKEKKLRIEVGYGLESRLTDAKSKRIISSIAPALGKGDFDSGLRSGATQIIQTINGRN